LPTSTANLDVRDATITLSLIVRHCRSSLDQATMEALFAASLTEQTKAKFQVGDRVTINGVSDLYEFKVTTLAFHIRQETFVYHLKSPHGPTDSLSLRMRSY
jgi:hypothetical protein